MTPAPGRAHPPQAWEPPWLLVVPLVLCLVLNLPYYAWALVRAVPWKTRT